MKLAWERVTVRPEHAFRISRGVEAEVERVWVRVEAEGVEGRGEADPSAYYGETADTVEAALDVYRPLLEGDADPWALEPLERRLQERLGGNASARAALSAALHDWRGRALGRPLWRLWGLDPAEAPPSSFTIGLDEPDAVEAKAREAVRGGYPILKIKVGSDRDAEVLEAVRRAAPEAVLRVDANAAWSAREALAAMPMLEEHRVEFVEQPLPPADREGLRFLHQRSALPIVLDESCLVAADIPRLVGLADGVNLKLAKCGGPREARRAIHVARACGLKVMLGCMLETTLGVAPAMHLAPLADWADLDGAALLADDPFRGPHLEGGRIVLGEEPGLGVEER